MRPEAHWQLSLRGRQQQKKLARDKEPSTPRNQPDSQNSSSPADGSMSTPECSSSTISANQYNGPSYALVMSQVARHMRSPRTTEPRSRPGSNRVSSSSRISCSSTTTTCSNGRLTSRAPRAASSMQRASSQPLPTGTSGSRRSSSTSPFSGRYKFTSPTIGSSSKSATTSPQISPRRRSTVQSAVAIQKLAVSLADAGIDDAEILALAACYKKQGGASIPAAAAEQQQGGVGDVALMPGGNDCNAGSSPFRLSGAMSLSSHNTTHTGMVFGDPHPMNNAAAAAASTTLNGSSRRSAASTSMSGNNRRNAASSSMNGSSRRSAANSSLNKSVAGRVVSIFGKESIPEDIPAAAAAAAAAATNIKARAAAAAAAAARTVAAAVSSPNSAATAAPFSPRSVATRPLSPSVAAAAASAAARPVSVAAAAAALMASQEIVGTSHTKMQLPSHTREVRDFFAAAAAAAPPPPATSPAAAAAAVTMSSTAADSSRDAQDATAAARSTVAAATAAVRPPATDLLRKDTGSTYNSGAVSAISATAYAGAGAGAGAAAADSRLASTTTASDLIKQLEELQQSLTAAKEAGPKEAAGIAAARMAAAQKAAAAAAEYAGVFTLSARASQSVTSVDDNVSVLVRKRAPSVATLTGMMEADLDDSAAATGPVMRRTLDVVTRSNSVQGSVAPTSSRSNLEACDPQITEDPAMISNIGRSNSVSKLEIGGDAFTNCSWGSTKSSTHAAINGSGASRAALPLSYDPQIMSNVTDPSVAIDLSLRPAGTPLKSIAEQHELLAGNSSSSSNGIEPVSTEGTALTGNSSSNVPQQDGATGLRIKVRSDSKLTGSTPVSEVERSDPRTWANTFFPGSTGAAEAAVAAATGAAATTTAATAAVDGDNSKLNTMNTPSTGVNLVVTEVKVASSAAQIKDKKLRGSNSSGDGSCSSSSSSFWRIGTCSIPSSTVFLKYHPRNDHSPSSSNWISRKVFLRILLPVLLLLAAVSVGIGSWAEVRNHRAKVAAAAVQQLGFEAVLVTSSADGDQACGRWFANDERIYLYRRIFAASCASALGVDMTAFNVMTITCGGSNIFTTSSSSSSSSAHSRHLMAAAATPDDLAASVSQQTISQAKNASMVPTQAAAAADQDNAHKSSQSGGDVDILTVFNVPAPASAKDSINKAVAAASAGILISPLSKFFDGPTALRSISPTAAAAAAGSSSAVSVGEDPGDVLHRGSGSSSASTGAGSGSSSDGSSNGTEIPTADAAGSSVNGPVTPQSATYAPGNIAAAAAAAASDKRTTQTTGDTTADLLTPPSTPAAAPAPAAPAKQQNSKQSVRSKVSPNDAQATQPPAESVAAAAAPDSTTASVMRMKKPAAAAGGKIGAKKLPSPPPPRSSAAAKGDNDPAVLDDTAAVTAAIAAAAASKAPKKTKVSANPVPAPAPAPEPEVPTADPVIIVDNPVITVEPTPARQTKSKQATAPTSDADTFSPPTVDSTAAGAALPVPVVEAKPVVVVPEQPVTQTMPTSGSAGSTFDPVYTPYDKSKDKSTAIACPFAATKTNSYAGADGTLWGFADGKECMFKKQ